MIDHAPLPPRTAWTAAIAAVPRAELRALADALAARHAVRHAAVPQAGAFLLTMEDGVFRDRWNIGEVPAATAAVEVEDGDGTVARGGAALLHATAADAVAAAVCDAVLAGRLAGWEPVAALVARGEARRAEAGRRRAAILATTSVDFAELGDEQT